MRPVDLQSMVALIREPHAPAVLCQAGFVFVNVEALTRHPNLEDQLFRKVEAGILKKLTQCSDDDVEVYSLDNAPEPAQRIRKREIAEMFELNK